MIWNMLGCIVFLLGLFSSIYMVYVGNIVLYVISLELCNIGILYYLVNDIYSIESDISCFFLFLLILGLSSLNTAINISILIKVKLFYSLISKED